MEQEPRKRAPNRRVNIDTVKILMKEIIDEITDEFQRQKELNNWSNLKFYREILSKTKQLEHDILKIFKIRKGRTSSTTGFLKPVHISQELAEFLKINGEEKWSRVQISKLLQAYILKKGLQNPHNRREIFPDIALSNLLEHSEKLTYPLVQKLIQKHFVKD